MGFHPMLLISGPRRILPPTWISYSVWISPSPKTCQVWVKTWKTWTKIWTNWDKIWNIWKKCMIWSFVKSTVWFLNTPLLWRHAWHEVTKTLAQKIAQNSVCLCAQKKCNTFRRICKTVRGNNNCVQALKKLLAF